MTTRRTLVLASLTLLFVTSHARLPLASQSRPQDVALQAAIRTETIDGDPKAAAQQFKTILEKYPDDRPVVALALVHLADCYRKLGDTAARDVYARVVRDYPDQSQAVQVARARLDSGEGNVAPVRRLWTLPESAATSGRVSWNGRWLAFVDRSESGAGDLFVRDFLTGTSRRVTKTGNAAGGSWRVFADDAVISRDGAEMVYAWFDQDRFELRVLRLQGVASAPKVLERDPNIEFVNPQDWTMDRRWIAAVWRRQDGSREIGLVSATDGSVRPLKSIDRACACRVTLALSPDGTFLAYDMAGIDTRTRDIHVVPTAGGAEIPAVVYQGDDALIGWAPDGRSIVFRTDRAGSPGLWSVPFAKGRAGSPAPVTQDIGAFSPLGITSAGAIYGCRCEPQAGSDIKVASLDFSTGRFLSPVTDAVQEYVGTNTQPFWSNDGRFFVYRSLRDNQDPILLIRSADSFELVRELRSRLASVIDPRWSPDDKSIAVIARDFENKFGYYRIDVETGKATPLVIYPPGSMLGPMGPESSWSPDSRKFYFRRHIRAAEESQFIEVDVITGVERVIVRLPGPDQIFAALSLDARTLYYRRPIPSSGEFAIVARDLASGTEREIIRRPSLGGVVNRSPDGKWLALTAGAKAGGPATLVIVPIDGGDPIELTHAEGSAGAGAPPLLAQGAGAWALDSRSIIARRTIDPDQAELWWLSVDGRGARKLEELAGSVPTGLRVHPDGKRLLFGSRPAGAANQPPKPTEVWVWEKLLAQGRAEVRR